MEASFLPDSVHALLEGAEPADLVIGVLTFNDKVTAPDLARTFSEGCAQAFPQRRTLVVNCDAGSQDGTPQVIKEHLGAEKRCWTIHHPVHGASLKLVSESGVPGREEAVRILMTITDRLNAHVCVVVDGNIKSADTSWPSLLAGPILEKGADCVLPWFRRSRYEGTLTNVLLAPLTRALYGKRIPYHLGGAYAFSGSMIRSTLLPQPWEEEILRYGIDGWVTTLAAAEPLQNWHAALGPHLSQAKPMSGVSTVVAQAVGCVFHLMERHQDKWESVRGSVAIPMVGRPVELGAEIGAIKVDQLVNGFRQGVRDLVPMWQLIMSPEVFEQVLELDLQDTEDFHFPSTLWVQVIYDFALAYHDRRVYREHLLKALTPLYLGYTASFIRGTRAQSVEQVQQELAGLSEHFESIKSYLIQRWRWRNE